MESFAGGVPGGSSDSFTPARLLLEDGREFAGLAFGSSGVAVGEIVFNTAMTGYQEILTDPSYAGQIVAMTCPLIGNYGTSPEDNESTRPQVAGFVVRELSRMSSSWRSRATLGDYLADHGVVAIREVDTRALTRHIRSRGAMRGGIAPLGMATADLRERILAHPPMEGRDLACGVSTTERYEVASAQSEPRWHVAALDLGVKSSSPRMLAERGCRVTVLPAEWGAEELLKMQVDGLFISNGPGDPAAIRRVARAIRQVAEQGMPVFGICLGHQLIARAFGGSTFKLPFGHHGANHPVMNHDRHTVEITSQNHGFAVRGDGQNGVEGAPALRITHLNLYDRTVAGIAHRTLPVMAVQYHPEAAPGPHDSAYLFDLFVDLMRASPSGRAARSGRSVPATAL